MSVAERAALAGKRIAPHAAFAWSLIAVWALVTITRARLVMVPFARIMNVVRALVAQLDHPCEGDGRPIACLRRRMIGRHRDCHRHQDQDHDQLYGGEIKK